MKAFKNIRFYLGAVVLIALVSVMWSLPIDLNAAGVAGETPPVANNDKAANAPGHIFDKDDTSMEKRRKLEEYLRGRYEINDNLPTGIPGIQPEFGVDGSLKRLTLYGKFTPPGLVKEDGATDEDLRAAAFAFLNAERDIFGINDAAKDLTEIKFRTNPSNKITGIRYVRYVEGLMLSGYHIRVVLKEDGTVITVYAGLSQITPEMVAAVKRFKAEGLDEEGIKELVRADLVKRGAPQEAVAEARFFLLKNKVILIEEEPYVVWNLDVNPPKNAFRPPSNFGPWGYRFNAITGEFMERESLIDY